MSGEWKIMPKMASSSNVMMLYSRSNNDSTLDSLSQQDALEVIFVSIICYYIIVAYCSSCWSFQF